MCPAAAPADETLGEFAGLGMGIHERGALYKVGPARTPLRRAATGAWPSLKLAAARHRACDRADNPLHMVLEGQTLYGEQHQKQKNQELGPCFHANRATLLCRERAATCRDAVDGLPDVEHILARKGNRARTLEDFACRRFRVQCRIKTCIWAKGSYLRKAPGCMQL